MEEVKSLTAREALEEAIVQEFGNIDSLELGSKERQQSLNSLKDYYGLMIEQDREADDYFNKQSQREMDKAIQDEKIAIEKAKLELEKQNHETEIALREAQLKSEKRKMIWDIGKGVLGLAAWIGMSLKVMKFEETGTIRSKAWTGTTPKWKFW